jgi:cellobiose transport system permease protein
VRLGLVLKHFSVATNRRQGVSKPLSQRRRLSGIVPYLALVVVAVFSIFPMYWSFVVASSGDSAIAASVPPMLPGGRLFDNIGRVFDSVDFWLAMRNSLIVSSTLMCANVLLASVAGFIFAHMNFRGRNTIFLLIVGTAMIPSQLGVIPLFLLVSEIGWYGQLQAVIVPGLTSAFSVFWMRQACEESVSGELLDSARIDGCSPLQMFRHVAWPAIRPQATVLAMLTFLAAWNDYFWPLVVLDPNDSPTVQVALSKLASGYFTDYSLMLTGATLSVTPILIVFFVFAKYIVRGVMRGVVRV